MLPVINGPRCNRRVTCDMSPSNDRSESDLAVNPGNPFNMVGASKRFTNPANYAFSLAAYATFDGGQSWVEGHSAANPIVPLDLLPGWAGTSDPAVTFDDLGNVYLVALPFSPGTGAPDATGATLGIAVYQSGDGGRTWGPPNLIHSGGDDKQWAIGDVDSTSPYVGNVYAAWDGGPRGVANLQFARTTDHGVTWTGVRIGGVDQPAGTAIPGITDSFAPELAVSTYGELYICWLGRDLNGQPAIKFVKSRDGGESFSAPLIVASPIKVVPGALPGGAFRVATIPTMCVGTGDNLVVAWADFRDNVAQIYYRQSPDRGVSWSGASPSGSPLLTGAAASPKDRHDFHPQLASTPDGEIGCAFYEFASIPAGEFMTAQQIDVVLAASTDDGATFPNRVTVTDHPWDPTVDPVHAHGSATGTFIGDYFGLAASRLGFFPFWTDTRTGVQEIFTSRLAVYPTDIYLRDSSADTGDVPSPGNHWESVDLIVRRHADVDAAGNNFGNEDLLRDGVTDHFIYGRVTNSSANTARNVRLAVTVGNYPSLIGLPGSEFRYPQDWYPDDWDTPALQGNHLFLGESQAVAIAGADVRVILGPVTWRAQDIPDPTAWHPCLLAEVRCDNDDGAGGVNGCALPAEGDTNNCNYGSFFWGNNNICQRNVTYAAVTAGTESVIEFPFAVGNPWSRARFIEVIVDKGGELATTPMTLRMDPIDPPCEPAACGCQPGEVILVDGARMVIRAAGCDVGEIVAAPGTVWRAVCPPPECPADRETCHGAERVGAVWHLTQRQAAVGFPIATGERRRMILSFKTLRRLKRHTRPLVRIQQRNDRQVITGGVILQLEVS